MLFSTLNNQHSLGAIATIIYIVGRRERLLWNSVGEILLLQERYRLLNRIGKGGFCKTFLAVDEGQFPHIHCVVQEFSLESETFKTFQQKAQRLEELGKISCFQSRWADSR
jgi:hypothetical protein